MSGTASIQVTVRVRPFTIREAAQVTKIDDGPTFFGDGSLASTPKPSPMSKGIRNVIRVVDDQFLVFDPPEENPIARFGRTIIGPQGKKQKDMRFGFDKVFDENATQNEVYESTTRNLLDSVLDGFNATVFAYGATGCGKTHTISGTEQQPGIIFLTMAELFQRIEDLKSEKTVELSLSYLEIYNETIRDLLIPGGSVKGLALREDSNATISVSGLSSHRPQTPDEVMDMIRLGNANRTMSPTEANATSSRSHAVLQVNVVQKNKTAGVSEDLFSATLSIIDLAGSERASVTKNRGERLLEGANINRSLLALGNCINALCDQTKKNHIPYRDSKLTRLLKFSLGGNCKTVMIVCISPSSSHYDETHNTLKYADRAKKIKTKVSRNMINVNRHVSQYVKAIYDLQQEVAELKKRLGDSVKEATDMINKKQKTRETVMKEGIRRIRAAYDTSIDQRKKKLNDMGGLRLMNRKMVVIRAWLKAFESTFSRGTVAPENLQGVKSMANEAIVDISEKKSWLQQRLESEQWDRSVDTALKSSLESLARLDGGASETDVEILTREANLQRSNGERDILQELMAEDMDAGPIEGLTKAHFQAIVELERVRELNPEEAVAEAAMALYNLIQICTLATGQVISPDGKIAIPEYVASTPGRRKPRTSNIGVAFSPVKPLNVLASVQETSFTSQLASPAPKKMKQHKVTPKKIKVSHKPKLPNGKREVAFASDVMDATEKKRAGENPDWQVPVKPWKMGHPGTPPCSTDLLTGPSPQKPRSAMIDVHVDSESEMPPPSRPSAHPPRNNRMALGFLAKEKAEGTNSSSSSPEIRHASSAILASATSGNNSTYSPLREQDIGSLTNRNSGATSRAGFVNNSHYATALGGAASSPNMSAINESITDTYSSADEQSAIFQPPRYNPPKLTAAIKLKPSLKRASAAAAINGGLASGPVTASFAATTAAQRARRRSPIRQGSPEAPAMRSGSGARRSIKETGTTKALSPRSSGVGVKAAGNNGARRLTVTGASGEQLLGQLQKENIADIAMTGLNAPPIRMR